MPSSGRHLCKQVPDIDNPAPKVLPSVTTRLDADDERGLLHTIYRTACHDPSLNLPILYLRDQTAHFSLILGAPVDWRRKKQAATERHSTIPRKPCVRRTCQAGAAGAPAGPPACRARHRTVAHPPLPNLGSHRAGPAPVPPARRAPCGAAPPRSRPPAQLRRPAGRRSRPAGQPPPRTVL